MAEFIMHDRLERLFDAVELNNSFAVKEILKENLASAIKIPARYIAGILIIATENSHIESVKQILDYNLVAQEKLSLNHMSGFYDLAHKMNLHQNFTYTLN